MEIKIISPTKFEISSSNHKVLCDQPQKYGGTDEGMNPVELFTGAMAACTAVFAMPLIKRRGFEPSKCSVKLDFEMADNPRRIGKIDIKFQIPGELSEDDKKALLKAADLCPLHNTFRNPPEINVAVNQVTSDG